jgi:HD-GYP domain-containing protein (c-di-GMP phosphodiesterase class II)
MMNGERTTHQALLEELDTEFRRHSLNFLNKFNAWHSGSGYTIHDKASKYFAWFREHPLPLKLLARLRRHHPASFTHSIDVCLLTGLQSERLGLPMDEVLEAAYAGLLHDVGKVAVPVEVLDKKEKLTRPEAARISVHSVAGAQALAALPGLPHLLPVGAYEHHLHHDGAGGYPRPTRCRPPHPVSQIIALADFFDSLTTAKPYRREQPKERVLAMMEDRRDKVFHPRLLDQFHQLLASLN